MNTAILNTESQEFINDNLSSDIVSLILKKEVFETVSIQELAEQITAKVRCEKKLPTWFNTPLIYYPNKLNIEQTSSEITAAHKANLVEGKSLVDLTGGFGVDCFYFSKKIAQVTHCEISKELSAIVAYNYQQLNTKNISCKSINGIEFIKENQQYFDWVYIDPSRRHEAKGKVFLLSDCLPNVPEHLDVIFNKTNSILIKTAPLLDITNGIKELKFVKEIHVIAVGNEVKELLWVLEKDYVDIIKTVTTAIHKTKTHTFSFQLNKEPLEIVEYGSPETYLYEPNAAILKSGAFNSVATSFNIKKLHKHSHLYTSEKLLENFPGRIFNIKTTVPYQKKELKKMGITKANITTRNFPETVSQIRKKLKIKDGGDQYLFFTTDLSNQKVVLCCEKVV